MMARERRQFSRVPQLFDVQYRLTGTLGESWRETKTSNVSAGGIRFRSEETLELGDSLEIRIELPGMRERLVLNGRVIWNQLQASGVMEHGVQFLDLKPEQQLQIDNLVQFLKKSA